MGIALVATDLDGTLLGSDSQPSPRGVQALREAAARGVTVALATGRMLSSARALQAAMGLSGPLLAYNGGRVAFPDGTVWEDPVPLAVARSIGALCRQRSYLLQSYCGDALLVPWEDERTAAYSRRAGIPCHRDPEGVYAPETPPTKLLLIVDPARREEVSAEIRERFGAEVDVSGSQPEYVEINRGGVNKGRALRRVAESLGIDLEAVLAVGDAENDIPMLLAAGIGAAVANAGPAVRAAAGWVAPSPYGEGVAEVLERFVLGV